MLKSTWARIWQFQSRKKQVMVNGSVLILLSFLVFYYVSWTFLQPITQYTSPESTVSISIPAAAEPSCPLPPTCPSSPPPPPAPPPPSPLPPSPYDPSKLAFLVETRPLPHLPALFSHMAAIIPPEWTFKFMGSNESISHMRSSPRIRNLEYSEKLQILPLPSNYSVSSRESISQMFTDPYLYSTILAPAEHLLVFQPDSIFCANSPKTLNDFLGWDWIGAPWSTTAIGGGNGGLSLRRISKVLSVLKAERRPHNDGALEDLWLTDRLKLLEGAQTPNATISKSFSVESVWDDQPLGYHVGWLGVHHEQIWDSEEQVSHIMRYCPEVKLVLGMKLGGDKPEGVP